MEVINIYILALIQGITEFLPISSSAHLALFPKLFSIPDQKVWVDVVLHFATLLAIVVYFFKDLSRMFFGVVKRDEKHMKMLTYIVVSSLPIFVVGYFFVDYIDIFRNIYIIIFTTVFFGILLLIADLSYKKISKKELSLGMAFVLGLSQVLALIPGVSRSGITMTTGFFMGLTKKESVRFSFLMSIPVISGAFLFLLRDVSVLSIPFNILIIGFLVAFVTALLVIHFFLKYVERIGLIPFAVYRIVLGAFLLFLIL